MIKISASISKKVPIPTFQYSSQAFGAALEIEVSDTDKPASIQARIRDLYELLRCTIDEQVESATKGRNGTEYTSGYSSVHQTGDSPVRTARPGNGNGTGRPTTA